MIEHHLVRLASDARLFVAAERRMCRIGMIAVCPHAASLDRTAETVGAIGIARPYARAEAVKGIVGDRERLRVILEGGDRDDRPEDLLLEYPHLVVAAKNGGLDVIAAGEIARQFIARAAREQLGAFLSADIEIRQD